MASVSYILHRVFVKPVLRLYLRRDRRASFDGFKMVVRKGVFHPLLFFSTRVMYDFLKTRNLKNKNVLEIGSGSGLLSMLAYKLGARVTSIDIDPRAVENTKENFGKNFSDLDGLKIQKSDVLSAVEQQRFDLVIINPPYYFKNVTHPSQQAWYCGEDGAYFKDLFNQLPGYLGTGGKGLMILEEGCDLQRIRRMAFGAGIHMEEVFSRKMKWETSTIYSLIPSNS